MPDGGVVEYRFELLGTVFHGGAEPDKDGDQYQEGIVEYAQHAQADGEKLAHARGFLGGQGVVHAQRQCRPQHATAIHGEGRQQVEPAYEEIHPHQAVEEGGAGNAQLLRARLETADIQVDINHEGEGEIDRRARQRHMDLLARVIGHFFQRGDPADGKQGDVAGANTVAPRRQRVAVLVEHHAAKQRQYETHPGNHRGQGALLVPVSDARQVDEKQETGMHVNVYARDPGYFP